MEKFTKKYFLAANSAEGFVSEFSSVLNAEDNWKTYIIKGGPGTGKSSFMKFIVTKAIENNLTYELCPCSSDPNSLDGVILPQKRIAFLDGTAPHTVDPIFAGVGETILNFGDFWNEDILYSNKEKIIALQKLNKAHHKTASLYMQSLGKLLLDNYKTALACTNKEKVNSFGFNLCKKYIPKGNGSGKEMVRFASGITPLGVVSYSKNLTIDNKNIIIIKDEFAAASNIIINKIKDYALQNGYNCLAFKNPFLPSLICDHLEIPELSLVIVREYKYMNFSLETRRIHSRRFTSNKQLHLSRERIKFNQKAIKELLLAAANSLSNAKLVHDKLESYYIKAMDFNKLTEFANSFCNKLF